MIDFVLKLSLSDSFDCKGICLMYCINYCLVFSQKKYMYIAEFDMLNVAKILNLIP